MKWLVIALFLSFCTSYVAGDIVEVKLDLQENKENKNLTCTPNVPHKVKYGEDKIKVKFNILPNYNLSSGHCQTTESDMSISQIKEFSKLDDYYVANDTINAGGRSANNTIECKFSFSCDQMSCENAAVCNIKLDLRARDIRWIDGNIYADGLIINSTLQTNENLTYDYEGSYKFFNGQPATFSCVRNKNATRLVTSKMFLYKKNEVLASSTGTSLEMYVKLKSDYDKGYIDCQMTALQASFVIRIQLNMEQKMKGFQVNGLLLPTNNDVSEYRYYDGEDLRVGYMDDNILKSLKCYPHEKLQTTLEEPHEIHLTAEEAYGNFSLNCSISKDHYSVLELNAHYMLKFNEDFYVTGISMAKVLLTYRQNNVLTTVYDYDGAKNLTIACFSNSTTPSIYMGKEEKDMGTVPGTVKNGLHMASREFEANGNITDDIITCIENGKKINIVLERRVNDSIKTSSTDKPIYNTDTGNNNSNGTIGDPQIEKGTLEFPLSEGSLSEGLKRTVIAVGIALLVICFLLVWIVCYVLKRRKRIQMVQNEDTNINYENLPAHNQGAMPVPKQWSQEAQYAAPFDSTENHVYAQPYRPKNVEELYSQPLPKRERPKQNTEEPGYETVNNDPKYSQIIHKTPKPGKTQVAPTDIEAAYAQIMKKSDRLGNKTDNSGTINPYTTMGSMENPYAEVAVSEASYAEANMQSSYAGSIYSENPYAEPNVGTINKYVNDFDTQRYVNTHAKDDYAEPAYCELDKQVTIKKK